MRKLLSTILLVLIVFAGISQNRPNTRLKSIPYIKNQDISISGYFVWHGDTIDFSDLIDSMVLRVEDSTKYVTPAALNDSLAALAGGHDPITLDANATLAGMYLNEQVLGMFEAGSTQNGYLSWEDWVSFNQKLSWVYHDSTLIGEGTFTSPLRVDTSRFLTELDNTGDWQGTWFGHDTAYFITVIEDDAFSAAWDGDMDAASKNAIYDYLNSLSFGVTDLSNTATPTTVIVHSSTGNDTNLPLATQTNAGLLAPGDKTKLDDLSYPIDTIYVSADNTFPIEYLNYLSDGEEIYVTDIPKPDGVYSGGIVTSQSGLIFSVSAAAYYIDGTLHTSASGTLTLTAADATYSRIDLFVVDTLGHAGFITGVPSANPQTPQYDPSSQLPLTSVLIMANATEPSNPGGGSISTEVVYDENTEWTTGASGVIVDFNQTTTVHNGSIAAEGGTLTNGDYISFTSASPHGPGVYETLSFWLKLKEALWMKDDIIVQLYLNGNPIGDMVSLNYNYKTTDWQFLTIDVSEFNTIALFNEIRITNDLFKATSPDGWYIDYVKLQGGINIPETVGDDWGDQVVQTDESLTGDGTIRSPLSVDDTQIVINENQIADLDHFTNADEADPVFDAHTVSNINDGTGRLQNDGAGNWSYDSNTYLQSYTETDPVFGGHIVSNIFDGTGFLKKTLGGVWSWDNTTYLSSETDPLYSAWNKDYNDLINTPSLFMPSNLFNDYGFTDNSANWNTAYGWGDHSQAGYLLTELDPVFKNHIVYDIADGTGFLKKTIGGAWVWDNSTLTETDPVFSAWDKDYNDLINKPLLFTPSTLFNDYSFTDNSTNWDVAYSWGDHALAGYIDAVTTTCDDAATLTNTTDVIAILDVTSGPYTNQENIDSVVANLDSWFTAFQTDNPAFQGNLYIGTNSREDYVGWLPQLRTNYASGFNWISGYAMTANAGTEVFLICFVNETTPDYYGSTIPAIADTSSLFIQDYNSFTQSYSEMDYFSGIVYPVTALNPSGAETNGLLNVYAAMKAPLDLSETEFATLAGTNYTNASYDFTTTSNAYADYPLSPFGWSAVLNKHTIGTSVEAIEFTFTEFEEDINSKLSGANTTTNQVSLIESFISPILTLRGLRSNSLSMDVLPGGCVQLEVKDQFSSTDFNSQFSLKTTDDLPEGTLNKYFPGFTTLFNDYGFTETDPTVPELVKGITAADTTRWGTDTDNQTAAEVPVTVQNGIEQNNVQAELEAIREDMANGGDGWGTDVVNHDETLTGPGTVGDPLKVDTTIIETKAHAEATYLQAEVDGSVTNELQVISISNDTIYLSDGGYVVLPASSGGIDTVTHTDALDGQGTTANPLDIADDAITYSKVAVNLTDTIVDNDLSWDFSGKPIIYSAVTGGGTIAISNAQVNKTICVVLTISSFTSVTVPAAIKTLAGSADFADGTFYLYIHCIGTNLFTMSVIQEAS